MTDLHIDHLLLRYEGTHADGARLQEIVERAMELAAQRLDAAMSDESIARVLADALVMKLEHGG